MAGQTYLPVRSSIYIASGNASRVIAVESKGTLSNTQQVASGDSEENQHIPNSPPPSFRSHESTPRSSQERVRQARQSHSRNQSLSDPLADAFDADGSDSDEDNDGDDRQRLMRGTPTEGSSREPASPVSPVEANGAIQLTDTTDTPRPVGQRPIQGRVYGGGSSGDGVWANLSAKPERGEKEVEEHPPVCHSPNSLSSRFSY